jgi:hypothetical protein
MELPALPMILGICQQCVSRHQAQLGRRWPRVRRVAVDRLKRWLVPDGPPGGTGSPTKVYILVIKKICGVQAAKFLPTLLPH